MTNILKYIFLGILQGITEILPISSSGHLMVFRTLFNTNMFDDLNFEIVIHFGSLIGLFIIFRKDIIKLIKHFFLHIFTKDKEIKKKTKIDFKYCLLIVVASIPAGIVGIIFKDNLEKVLESIKIVGVAFLVTALALILVRNLKGNKEEKDITYLDATIIGLMQAMAIVPGLSRSGSTIAAALFRGLKQSVAAKFVFLMFFPISIGSFLLGISDIISSGNLESVLLPYTAGLISSAIVTYLAAKWFFESIKKGKLWKFAIYCIIIGIFTLLYL